MATVQEKIDLMKAKKEHIMQGGGAARIEKQHAKGKYTARERIERLFDPDSFVELDMFMKHRCTNFGQDKKDLPGEGVVTGYGRWTAAWSMLMPRTSPSRAAPLVRSMPIRSGRSWIWP